MLEAYNEKKKDHENTLSRPENENLTHPKFPAIHNYYYFPRQMCLPSIHGAIKVTIHIVPDVNNGDARGHCHGNLGQRSCSVYNNTHTA